MNASRSAFPYLGRDVDGGAAGKPGRAKKGNLGKVPYLGGWRPGKRAHNNLHNGAESASYSTQQTAARKAKKANTQTIQRLEIVTQSIWPFV